MKLRWANQVSRSSLPDTNTTGAGRRRARRRSAKSISSALPTESPSSFGDGPSETGDDLAAASDAVLHVLLLRRSKEALAEVYRRHGDAVFGAAQEAVDGTATAEDLTCARFVDLFHNPGAYKPQLGSLRSYLVGAIPPGRVGSSPAGGTGSALSARRCTPPPHSYPGAAHALLESRPASDALILDLASFGHYTCRQIAQLLNEPERHIRRSVRDGLEQRAGSVSAGRPRDLPLS